MYRLPYQNESTILPNRRHWLLKRQNALLYIFPLESHEIRWRLILETINGSYEPSFWRFKRFFSGLGTLSFPKP